MGSYGGTQVRIHATFLLLLLLIGWQARLSGGPAAALDAVLFILAMFLCVVLHEFGHVLAARRYGIQTPEIILLPIGGVALLERMPRKPEQELAVAIAGPAVNVVIATAIFLFIKVMPPFTMDINLTQGDFFTRIAQWNVIMVLFNMIPAFPMDGGRVLRATLAMFMNYGRATRLAATLGQGFAVLGAVGALFVFQNPLLIIVALFIFMSAGQEANMVSEQEATRGLLVRDAMVTEFHSLGEMSTLQEAVDRLLTGTQHDFPVVNRAGEFLGLLTRNNLIAELAKIGPNHPVMEAMQPCEDHLDPRHPLEEAIASLRSSGLPALPVLDPITGRVTGLLTSENIGEVLMVRAALQQRMQ